MTYIPLDQCQKGGLYKISSRNLSFGVFDGNGGFIGIREKFGDEYLFTEYHWDTGAPYGTVHPLELLEMCPLSDISESVTVTATPEVFKEEGIIGTSVKFGEPMRVENKAMFHLEEKAKEWYAKHPIEE